MDRHDSARRRSLLTRLLLAACAALLAAAPGAQALDANLPPAPIAPADGTALPTGAAPLFRVQTQPGDGSLWLHISTSPSTDAQGLIHDDVLEAFHPAPDGADLYDAQPAFFDHPAFWLNQPGTYYWQAHRISYADGADGAIEGPVRRFTLVGAGTPPAPGPGSSEDLTVARIPRWVAPYRRSRGFVISRAGLPATVDVDRWVPLVRTSAKRWGLRVAGQIPSPVRPGNYRNEVGFSRDLSRDKLGVTTSTMLRRYRLARVCGVNSCRLQRQIVSERLIDRDVRIDARVRWEQGPAYPDAGETDLQTVLIHELGHVAGNGHQRYCVNSPMVVSLSRGEWWRTEDDYQWMGCGRTARIATATRSSFEHRVIRIDVPVSASPHAVAARLARLGRP